MGGANTRETTLEGNGWALSAAVEGAVSSMCVSASATL